MDNVSRVADLTEFFACDKREIITKLQNEHLLVRRVRCRQLRCRRNCVLRAKADRIGGYVFHCSRCKNTLYSVATGTFFETLRTPFQDVFLALWAWSCLLRPGAAAQFLGMNRNTVYQLNRFFRDIVSWKLLNSPQLFLFGGQGEVVQVDESVVTKRKYQRGRLVRESWVLGIYDVQHKKGSVIFVPDRTTETLCALISQHVLPGTEIWSDCWAAYNGLDVLGGVSPYVHKTVNHSQNFVDPQTGVCTNHVEGFWGKMKGFCRRLGVMQSKLLPEHIDHFMWLQHFGSNHRKTGGQIAFRNIVAQIKEKYPM